jgi:hypothetical protein
LRTGGEKIPKEFEIKTTTKRSATTFNKIQNSNKIYFCLDEPPHKTTLTEWITSSSLSF